jgi:hypothetical protein
MRSYTNLAVVALAASSLCPVLSAPTQYTDRYGNLLVELKEFKGRAFLISGIPILDSAVDVFRAGSENNSKRPRPESPPIGDQPPDEEPRRKKKQKTEGSFGGSESSDRNFVHGLPPAPEGSSGGSDSSNRNFVQGLPPAPPPSPESPNHPLPTYTNYIPRSASVSPILHSRIDSDSGSDPGPKSDPDSKPALEPETTPARRDLVDR